MLYLIYGLIHLICSAVACRVLYNQFDELDVEGLVVCLLGGPAALIAFAMASLRLDKIIIVKRKK